MAGYTEFAKNAMLDSLTVQEASLHSADPGDTGANELDDTTIYQRQPLTLDPATGGERLEEDDIVFEVSGGDTVEYVGFWDDVGNFLGSTSITTETFSADSTYTLTSVKLDLNAV